MFFKKNVHKKNIMSSLIFGIYMGVLCLSLSACTNKEVSQLKQVEDPLTIVPVGIDGEVLDNVNAHLNELPQIPAKKAPIFEREIKDKVKLAMRSYGFYHPKIELKHQIDINDNHELLVAIDPGKPLFIRNCNIQLIGEGAFYNSFQRIIANSGLKSYGLLSHGRYENLKTALRERALELGFFDAELIISRIMVYGEQNAADIEVLYDTGKRYSFGSISYVDKETENLLKPVQTLQNFHTGDPFSSNTISNYVQSLSQTQYFRSVDVRPMVEKRHDFQVPVEIGLQKQKANLVRMGIGYSTDEDVRVMLGWDKPLLNSYGHSLSFYSRLSSVKQDAQAIYKIPRKNPNLDYYYVRLAQIHTDYNDTVSDVSHASFHYVANMTGKWRRDYSLRLEYEDYKQGLEDDYSLNLMPGVLLTRQASSGGFDPHEGYKFSLDATLASAAITDNNFARFVASFKGITSPTPNTRFFYRFNQGWILGEDSSEVPPSLRFFVGGDQSIRGFSYLSHSNKSNGYLSGGRYMSTGTLEYQFPIGIANSRMALFVDAGTACKDYSDAHWIYAPGMGYRYMSKYGTARVDFAVGIDNENDDRSFKLHFSFGPEF